MRLIDSDRLEEILKDYYKTDCNQPYGGMSEDAIAAMSAIDHAPTIDTESVQQGWISVKDSLPPLGESVLTRDKRGGIRDRNLRRDLYGNKEARFSPDGLLPGKNITHWMPLPKPPAENREPEGGTTK